MSKLIALADGHGMSTSGKRTPIFPSGSGLKSETGNFMHENEFNRAVVKYLDIELRRCGFRTLLVAPTDYDTPLSTRVATANNAHADLFVAIHANANTGKWGSWGGTETYTYGKGESLNIGKIVHKHLMKGTPMRDRGVKDGSWLYVVRNTRMPAILVEAGFMDNLNEAKLLLSDAFRRECAREVAMGICEHYGVKYVSGEVSKPTPSPSTWYRVRLHWSDPKTQVGAFQDLENAKDKADEMKSKGDYKVFDEKGNVVYDPTPVKADEVWYRVRKSWSDSETQVGAFHELEGAKECADQHAKEGYKVFNEKGEVIYEPKVIEENEWYRVRVAWDKPQSQIGAFKDLDGAKQKADENAHDGYRVFDDNGKVVYEPKVEEPKPEPPVNPKPEPVDPHKGHTPIMGKSKVSADKMVAFVKEENPNAQDIEEIAKCFVDVGEKYNIRGDIAFCQSLIETGWFKFDGGTTVTPDQHNYCGMGVTSRGMKGNSFDTVRDGVTAQIQHLYCYASTKPIPSGEKLLDPRFFDFIRGKAIDWEDLSMRWAMNEEYGEHILSLYSKLVDYDYIPPVVVEEPKPEPPTEPPINPEPPVVEEPKPQEPPVEEPPPVAEQQEEKSVLTKILEFIFKLLKDILKGGK